MSQRVDEASQNISELRAKGGSEPIASLLGMKLVELTPGYAKVSMKLRPEYQNFNGLIFGGMVMAVADSSDEAAYVKPLEAKGYTLRIREPDWYEHRLLKTPEIAGNLHVFSAGCPEIERMVLFRDWLRSHADDRSLYAATKRELAVRTWKYTQNYADAKSEVVEAILARARQEST